MRKNWLEWCVFTLGCVLVLGTAGWLAYDAWRQKGSPPSIEVQLGTATEQVGHFALPVTVINRGDTTAERVLIEVVGWVTFRSNPQAGRLVARPLGYEIP
jgi:uncharacterized protein (TIGR02588 family)